MYAQRDSFSAKVAKKYHAGMTIGNIANNYNSTVDEIYDCLVSMGFEIAEPPPHPSIWDMDEDDRRAAIIERAAAGARAARIAAGIKRFPDPKPSPANDDAPLAEKRRRWRTILDEVSDKHSIPVADIVRKNRSPLVVVARHEAMYRIRNETPLSLPEIGMRLGGRDHTTVLHGARRHEERMEAGEA